VGSIPGHAGNFSPPDCEIINKALSYKIFVNHNDYLYFAIILCLWRDSDKGVDFALKLAKSILIILFMPYKNIQLKLGLLIFLDLTWLM